MKQPILVEKNKLPAKKILWIITDRCNYRCTYCFTEGKDRGIEVENPSLFLRNIGKKLDGNWHFEIVGGEPFVCKNLLRIVKGLIGLGHRITLVTNFSAGEKKIEDFLKITRGSLDVISASLHLEYATPDDFLEKILRIRRHFPDCKIVVSSVATKEKLPYLEEIKKKFFKASVPFFWRPYRDSTHFFQYSKSQKKIIEKIAHQYNLPQYRKTLERLGTYGLDIPGINFKGRKCSAGHRYFFLLPTGDAYSCPVSARQQKNFLGNILENNFKLNQRDMRCPFNQCFCPLGL